MSDEAPKAMIIDLFEALKASLKPKPQASEATPMDDNQPTMTCPQCKREEPDFDGFGMLAHTKPAYEHGCGYCTHAGRTGGVCDYCGDTESA